MPRSEFPEPLVRDTCPYNCLATYHYVAADCPLEVCNICANIANLDAEIFGVHDQLGELLQKRRQVERKVNISHDIPIHRFTVEIMILIFQFFAPSNERGIMAAPLILGAVCERWRDITLIAPLMWDTVIIHPPRDSTQLDMVKEWLGRSQILPLSLTVQYKHTGSTTCPPFANVLSVLKLHSSRWKTLKLLAPSVIIHGLLHNLQNVPNVIRLRMDIPNDDRMENVVMSAPLRPKTFHAKRTSMQQNFLDWDNLTRLDVAAIKMDELIHIIRNGIHLTECTATYIAKFGRAFPLPTAPFVHESLKYIKTTSAPIFSDFLQYLTLPSLKKLHYEFTSENAPTAVPTLNAFLDRSAISLQSFTFTFNVDPHYNQQVDWSTLKALPRITHLVLDIEHYYQFDMTTALFSRLNDVTEMYLPQLRALKLTTPTMRSEAWHQFNKLLGGKPIQDKQNSNRSNNHSNTHSLSLNPPLSTLHTTLAGRLTRPLESVIIHLKERFNDRMAKMMDPYVPYLLEVEKSGVHVELVDSLDFDMLHRTVRVKL